VGRLFWKFILAFWLAFAAISLTIAATYWVLQQTHSDLLPWGGRGHDFPPGRAGFMRDTAAVILASGPPATLRATLLKWQSHRENPTVYVIDARGRDVLGRRIPDRHDHELGMAQRVRGADGLWYTLLLARSLSDRPPPPPPGFPPGPPHGPPGNPLVMILSALLVSLGFSAWMAWYFSRPIRHLRWAFRSAAQGRLETRVQPLMGRRRDEIADLGRDFDRMAQQLQQQIGAQQRLLHDISHELRSPLARLQAAIGLARQNPRRIDMTLARIEHESIRLDALVSEVLTLARLESGVNGLQHQQVDLVELLSVIVDDAAFEARAMQRDVCLSGAGKFVVDCIGELLYRSFENVIRNALKYTGEQTTVRVTVLCAPESLLVTVADQGPGVAPAQLENIFEPFYRVEGQGATESFGLGLAIARRAVESHAGKIWAESGEQGGLVVHIWIPAHAVQRESSDGPERGSGRAGT
jgi:two-component system OmpR family sensor kinase